MSSENRKVGDNLYNIWERINIHTCTKSTDCMLVTSELHESKSQIIDGRTNCNDIIKQMPNLKTLPTKHRFFW